MNAAKQGAERTDLTTVPPIIRRHYFGIVDHVVVEMPAPIINATAAAVRPKRAAGEGLI